MALTIGTNVASLQASAAASSVNRDLETSMARLSTGKRINSASDDAAGVAIASRLSSEIRGTDQAIRNALDGQALVDTTEGGHKEIEAILQRMREVAVQAANETNSLQDKSNLQTEMDALKTEIDRIASVTTWAGQSMMASGGSTFSLQVGAATGDKNQIQVNISSVATADLGLYTTDSSITTPTTAKAEFKINTTDNGEDIYGELTALKGGGFVSSWQSQNGSKQDTRAQIFDNNGVAISTTDIKVNSTDTGAAYTAPFIGALEDGGFVATWNENADSDVVAQRYDALGNALGSKVTVNTHTTGGQSNGTVTGLSDGGFVVTFHGASSTDARDVMGQLYSANGTAVGDNFLVAQNNTDIQTHQDVVALKDGGFAVTWMTQDDAGTASAANYQLAGRVFDSSGVGGQDFTINQIDNQAEHYPKIAALEDGGFVTSWTAGDAKIRARMFDASGTASSDDVIVSATTGSSQSHPDITGLADGGFMVAWDGPGAGYDIRAARFDAKGSAVGDELHPIGTTTGAQSNVFGVGEFSARLATLSNGKIALTWSANLDGNTDIYGTILDAGVAPASITDSEIARSTIDRLDKALSKVNTQRSELGAISNRLSHTVSNMTNISTNLSAARGGIEDADFALETTNLAKNQILQQASTAMLAQANASKQNVLSLLQ